MVRARTWPAADPGLGDSQAGSLGWLVVRGGIPGGRAGLAVSDPGPGTAAGGGRARLSVGRPRGGLLATAAPAGHRGPRARRAGRHAQLLADRSEERRVG